MTGNWKRDPFTVAIDSGIDNLWQCIIAGKSEKSGY
jgi:hypothetical protein